MNIGIVDPKEIRYECRMKFEVKEKCRRIIRSKEQNKSNEYATCTIEHTSS